MNAIDRLRRDHTILRSKLNVLEAALGMGEPTWFVLREVCCTLSRQLRDHIRREEELISAYRTTLSPELLHALSVEHHDEPRHLRTINRLFTQETSQSLRRIAPILLDVIAGLRKHMDDEERDLFPILARTLGEQEAAISHEAISPHLYEQMTVNRVLQAFPQARATFERLFINVFLEGSCCLDEVAWLHGMESRELLNLLEDAIEPAEDFEPATQP